ncbi:MAG TPA: hypothetical protein VHA78_06140 [Candidatus Peribacteraceae bacterium]|nr:hypothetical protein [Candidatus Peribacteraceae bacterium]
MASTHTSLKTRIVLGLLSGFAAISPGLAQVYNGGGIGQGINATGGIAVPHTDLRTVVINIIRVTLSYLALAATVMIIVAGLYLVLSLGNESARDKAKNIIVYTIIGLVIILFSELIVNLVLKILS